MDERSWGDRGARLSRLQASSDFGSTLGKAGQQQGKSAFFSLVGKGADLKADSHTFHQTTRTTPEMSMRTPIFSVKYHGNLRECQIYDAIASHVEDLNSLTKTGDHQCQQ